LGGEPTKKLTSDYDNDWRELASELGADPPGSR
jgi:hypothetical protein